MGLKDILTSLITSSHSIHTGRINIKNSLSLLVTMSIVLRPSVACLNFKRFRVGALSMFHVAVGN